MAKTANIGRLSVDFLANTTTYKAQLQQLSVETDKRLSKLENTNRKHNSKIISDDKSASGKQKNISKDMEKFMDQNIKAEQKRQNLLNKIKDEALKKDKKRKNAEVKLQQSSDLKKMRSGRMRVQQAGFQLQDSIVQAQMGIDATVIVAQQGSQFLGAFGASGAIMGAVLAIGAVGFGILRKVIKGAKIEVTDFNKELDSSLESFVKLNKASKFSQSEDLVFGDTAKAKIKDYDKSIIELTKDLERAQRIQKSTTTQQFDPMSERDAPRMLDVPKSDKRLQQDIADVNVLNNKLQKATEIREFLTKVINAQTAEERKAIISAEEMINKSKEELKFASMTDRQKEERILLIARVSKAERDAHFKRVAQAKGMRDALELQKTNKKSILDTITALKNQNNEYGRNAVNLAIYKAGLKGATVAQRVEIGLLVTKLELLKKETKERKEANRLVDSIAKSNTSPKARLDADALTLAQADAKGLIESKEALELALFNIEVKYEMLELADAKKADAEKERLQREALKKYNDFIKAKRLIATNLFNFLSLQQMSGIERIQLNYERELELLGQKQADELAMYADTAEKKALIDAKFKEQQDSADAKRTVETTKLLGTSLDDIGATFGKQLQIQQVFTQSSIALNQAMGISQTLSDDNIPFYGKAVAVVSMIAQFAKLRTMMRTNSGQMHGGTDEIPTSMNNKSFILKAGERVVQPEANKKLTAFLNDDNKESSAYNIEQNINMGSSIVDRKTFDQALAQSAQSLTSIVQREQRIRSSKTRRR